MPTTKPGGGVRPIVSVRRIRGEIYFSGTLSRVFQREVMGIMQDDELRGFEMVGAAPLPVTAEEGAVAREGARIWYAAYGSGPPVILLHGGLGQSGNWGYQVPALVAAGYRVVVIDSR